MINMNMLQNQAGIQFQGVKDKSEANPTASMVNFIMTGQFKRGRFDKPFKVTKENVRSKLGYDPQNPDYVAVEDALSDGAPYIYVQRVVKSNSSSNPGSGGSLSCYNFSDSELIDAVYPYRNSAEIVFISNEAIYASKMREVFYEQNKNLTIDIHFVYEGNLVLQVKGLALANIMPIYDPNSAYGTINVSFDLSLDDCVGHLAPFSELFNTQHMKNIGFIDLGTQIDAVNISFTFIENFLEPNIVEANISSQIGFRFNNEEVVWDGIRVFHTFCLPKEGMSQSIGAYDYDKHEIVDIEQTMHFSGSNTITAIGWLGGAYNLGPVYECTPTIIPINNGLMGVDRVQYKYSINGGTIFTSEETTDSESRIHTNLVNFLAYSKSILQMEHTKYIEMNDYKRFLVSYDYPVQGAPSNGNQASPMTVEFWAIPGADNCFATIAFGGDFVLTSCGSQYWNETTVRTE